MSDFQGRWMSASQVAEQLGVSTTRVKQLRQSRELRGKETCLGYFYLRQDVLRLARKREQRARMIS